MKINFLGLGVQKAGTSTLHDILRQHTQIYLPEMKEAHFFDVSERYVKGLEWLKKTFFSNYAGQQCVGAFTPEYLYVEEVPERIYKTLGNDLKFIVVLRHPVDRAVSHYNMIHRRGMEIHDFFTAIKDEQTVIKRSESANLDYSYMSRGYYAEQIKRYFEIFPRENFLFLEFKTHVVNNIEQTAEMIQNFLGVDYQSLNCIIKSNEAFVPRFIKLNQVLKNNKAIKFLGRLLFTGHTKKIIISKIYKWNKTPNNNRLFKLSKAEKDMLFEKYFKHDASQLKDLTGIDYKLLWNEK